MAKVYKSTISLYGSSLEARKFKENGSKSTIKRDVQNNGSALGYLGGRLAIGTAGLFEGFGDFVAGSVYQLAGDREYAKYLHDNDVTGGWQKKLDEAYNPSRGMQIAGDIASGVGQALPSVAVGIATGGTSTAVQVTGTVALGTAYAGRGVTAAVQKTGELGAKENAYGVLSGLSESITEMFLGGTQKAGKALWTATRGTVKAGASKVARNGLVKGIWSSSSSEFMEEFLQEYLDTGLLRLTGVDSEASTSLGDALYSGMIGGITGGLLGGATNTLNASNNVRRGESIRARGLESQLLKTANYIRSDYLGKGADFSKIQSEGLRTLSAAVDAYNQLDAKEKANGMRGAMLLGEIQVGAAAFETEVGIRKRTAEIMANPSEEMAQYASMIAGKVVTVADLSANRDGIAETLALRNFTADIMSESGTDRAVNAIHNKIEQERYAAVREGAAWDGSLSEDGEMVFRAPDGRFVIVTADSTEGHEGNYRVGFSETAEYDPDHIKMNENVSLADLKKGLAGLANGSMVIGENRLEGVKAQENAPAGGESVVGDQVSADGLNEAQRGGNAGNKRSALTQTEEDNGSGRKALPTKRARGDKSKNEAKRQRKAEQMAAEMREARENEPSGMPVPTDGEARAEMRGRGYTDAEANAARGLVKDFDLLQPQARRAIIEMMRSGKATGASRTFMRHAANLIDYWRRDLWVMCDDKIRDDGFFYVFDDGTRLITVKPKAEGRSISEALMHELGHDVWQRANAETRKALYDLAVDGAKKGEIEEIRKRYRDELDKRGDLEGLSETEVNELLDEEVAVNLLGEVLGKEEFLERLAGGEVSVIKRFLRTLSVMKKRFTGKDKYLYRKADDLFRAFTRVMAGQTVTGVNGEKMQVGGRKRYSLNGIANAIEEYREPINITDVKKLKEIAKKRGKVNIKDLSDLEIEALQKWAYKYWSNSHTKIKSPFFRAWFGDWRASTEFEVAVVDTKSDNRKEVVNEDTGWVVKASRKVHKETNAHKGKAQVTAVKYLPYIDDITKKAILFDSFLSDSDNENSLMFHTMYAYTEAMGYPALLKLKIEELFYFNDEEAGVFQRDYILQNVEEESLSKLNRLSRPNRLKKDSSVISIAELYALVKNYEKNFSAIESSKAVNADGTPMLLYHQTAEEFEEFDPHHKGAGTNDDETPFGIFMKPTAEDIGLKGKKQMALYARILSPLMVSDRADLANQLKKMSPTYKQLIDQRKALSGEYQQKIEDAAKKWAQYAKEYRIAHPDAPRSEIYEDAEFNKLYEAEDILTEEWIEKADQLAEKCKEEITKTLRENGYDGVIIKKDDGSFGRSVETYIALDATQVKSATDNIGTFDRTNANIRRALPKAEGDDMIARAYERGSGVKSQTGENSEANAAEQKPKRRKKTNLQIRSEERARADRQIARAKQSAENARKNAETYAAVKIAKAEEQAARRVRNAEASAENARKNAEKKLAAERERLEREAENSMNRSSRKTSALNRNIQYLKNAVSHRKHTDGGNDAARVLENSALKGFIRYFANRTAANGVANKATREAVRGLLPWYTAENEVLSGNVLDKLLAKSDKNTNQIFGSYDPEVRARMEALAEGEGNLTAAELESLGMIVGAIARLYESYGRVHLDGRWQDVEGLAREQYADLLAARKALVSDTDENGKYKGALKRLRTFLTQSYLYSAVTPEAVLRDLEGNTKSGVLSRLYRKVRLGEAESKRVQANILQPVAEFFAEKENRAYRRELSTKKRFEYRGEMLTAAQAVGLWETSKREHAQERLYDLEKGGFRIAVLDEATGRVVTKKLKATAADIDALAHQFTEQDKAYIKALEEAYRRSTEYKIEADRRILGYTNAIEGHYYPITTDENYFARDVTDIRDKLGYAQVVYNKSFNKNTVEGAQAWLFVEDSLKVLNRHASGIGAYSGLFEPLQNFGRVYGAKFEPTGQSVKEDAADEIFFESVVGKTSLRGYINETLWSKHGGHGTDLDGYLTKLFSDVQGIRGEESGVDRLVAKIQGAAVTASFGLNLKVIATQLASYPMAFKNLDADVLAKALGMQPDMEAMDKYSRFTFARSFDGTGAAEGGLERLSEVGRLATKGIDFTDRQVIGRLWVACQLQVEKDGGEAFGSEENMRAAGDLLDNLLLDTQTTSLKADASALGRDKNVVAKMLTMFKTESMKSFSNLYGAFSAYVDHRRYAEAGMDGYSDMLEDDKRRIGKTVTAFLMSNAWVAVVAVAFSRIRKAARGEEEEEKIAVSMIKEMGGNVADLFPVVSEISSYLMDGYDMDYMPIASINDTLSMIAKVGVLTDSEASAAEKNKYLRQSVITLGELVGLPTRNAGRIALTLTSNVSASSAYLLRDRYDTAPTYQSDLDRALASGNERLAATVLSAWFDRQKGGRAGDAVAKELMRLYVLEDGEGKKLLSLPKSIPSSLGAAQAAAFSKIYAEADGKVAALLSSAAYGKLDDAAKAKAIRACYDTEWSRAASSLGLEVTGGAEKLAAAEGADPSILAAAAGFAKAYSGEGRKAAVIQYLSSLGLSEAERAVYMAALGYKV